MKLDVARGDIEHEHGMTSHAIDVPVGGNDYIVDGGRAGNSDVERDLADGGIPYE